MRIDKRDRRQQRIARTLGPLMLIAFASVIVGAFVPAFIPIAIAAGIAFYVVAIYFS